jgi:trimeric autotransporter adhesin
MAYRELPFVGVISANSIVKENFIIAGGNFASASNQIADFNVSSGDESLLRVGQTIYSVAGVVPTNATITNINGSLITMDTTASADAASDTIGISTPSGSYLFQSASFTDPRGELSVGSITGSDDDPNARFAVLGVAKRSGATRPGAFHLYNVSEVVYDNIGSSEISFFVEWGEEGTEADSGDILQTSETTMVILDKTASGSLAAGISREITGLEGVVAGSEVAGYNLAITQYLSDLSGSAGTSATGSFTGSFTGSVLGDLIGTASIADFATTASYISTASFADTATTASLALEAITASLALQAESASVAARATTLSPDATASFADRATTASIADELSQLATASFALTASHALNVPNTASHALTAVTASQADRATSASIADELSQLATASFADSATTASYALYAVSASHEIIHEESSSLAETASLAISLSPEATASQADSATTASFALTASHALNVPDTASHALTAVSASIADELSQLATASFADSATSASYAETASYAFSASVEITKEVSSSLADTASFAQSGDGDFSGVFSGSNYSTEFTFDGEVLNVMGNVFVQGTLDAATKNFKIQHPTMPAYYLVHSSLEGPERGIYHRGKLKTSNIIHLPDYWLELTDDTDITVQLTPIGNSCQHFVKSVSREEIEVGCDCGKPHCFYIVHAQRYNEGKFEILEPKLKKSL